MEEDVVGLDVPVHDITAGQHFERLHDLLEEEQSPLLGKWTFLLHQFVESAPVAVLIDEVEVIGSLEHVDVLDDVGAGLQRGEDVDFIDSALL